MKDSTFFLISEKGESDLEKVMRVVGIFDNEDNAKKALGNAVKENTDARMKFSVKEVSNECRESELDWIDKRSGVFRVVVNGTFMTSTNDRELARQMIRDYHNESFDGWVKWAVEKNANVKLYTDYTEDKIVLLVNGKEKETFEVIEIDYKLPKQWTWKAVSDDGCFEDHGEVFNSPKKCYEDMRAHVLEKMKWNTEWEDFDDKSGEEVIGYEVKFSPTEITHKSYSGLYTYKMVGV